MDNAFAGTVLASIGAQAMKPRSSEAATLCDRCRSHNFWSGGFAFEDRVTDLEGRAKICEFCTMVHDICVKSSTQRVPKVRIERKQSTLMMAGGDPLPVLSIFRSPGM